ncbi:hypothetical protein, partial [Caldimonas tepidiphila]|uniref:hypothetical protein n=1 Tax=Caldimonas tepidiphila TaxID=2315841 RepID=UPI00196A71F9
LSLPRFHHSARDPVLRGKAMLTTTNNVAQECVQMTEPQDCLDCVCNEKEIKEKLPEVSEVGEDISLHLNESVYLTSP